VPFLKTLARKARNARASAQQEHAAAVLHSKAAAIID
jgi:hypothetical protein